MKTYNTEPNITAGELLNRMRPSIEETLQRYKGDRPACESQSHRCIHLLEHIKEQMAIPVEDPDERRKLMLGFIHDREQVNTFLAVHRTVVMLEQIARNGYFNF